MPANKPTMDDTKQARVRWFHPTPGRFVLALLAVEVLLWLSERSGWLSERLGWLGWHKGYAVLTGMAAVGVAMVLMLGWFGIALVCRWRFQFSIRSLLVLVVVVALPFSWLAVEMKRAREQRAAIQAIQKAGGFVWYDCELDSLGGLVPNPQRPAPQWLRRLLGDHFFDAVTSAYVWDDVAMTYLAQLPRLQELFLISNLPPQRNTPPPRPINYKLLGGSTITLDKFSASGRGSIETQIVQPTVSGLDRSRFAKLAFACTLAEFVCPTNGCTFYTPARKWKVGVGSATLANLRALTRLRVLSLEGTAIEDDGLEHIQELTQLRELYLFGSRVTDAGVKKLQQALPNCHIEY